MMSLLLFASLGLGLDAGGLQRPSADRPSLRDFPPEVAPIGPSFVVVDRPEAVDVERERKFQDGIQIVERPEPATTRMEAVPPRIQYLHNGLEIEAKEFYRRLLDRQRR